MDELRIEDYQAVKTNNLSDEYRVIIQKGQGMSSGMNLAGASLPGFGTNNNLFQQQQQGKIIIQLRN